MIGGVQGGAGSDGCTTVQFTTGGGQVWRESRAVRGANRYGGDVVGPQRSDGGGDGGGAQRHKG